MAKFGDDLQRWCCEMEAERVEDEDVWFVQSHIVVCVDPEKNCGRVSKSST
jgi:hypothetical protein